MFPGGAYDSQQIRYRPTGPPYALGLPGVIVDVDPEYSLAEPEEDEIAANDELRAAPGTMW